MTTKTEKTGFLAKVMAKLTGGDEGKIARFQAKTVKFYKTQINIRNSEIDDLNEKKDDLKEKFEDVATGVDLEAIKTTEGLEAYIPTYTKKLTSVTKEIVNVDTQIKIKKEEIAEFKALVDVLE